LKILVFGHAWKIMNARDTFIHFRDTIFYAWSRFLGYTFEILKTIAAVYPRIYPRNLPLGLLVLKFWQGLTSLFELKILSSLAQKIFGYDPALSH